MSPVDAEIAALARRQHGNVTRRQLLAIGLDSNAIAYRLKTGRLFRLHAGVYSVGHRPVNDARHARSLSLSDLAEVVERCPRHPGAARLAVFVERLRQGLTRSDLEDAFVAFCERFALPRPATNTMLAGYQADALFAPEKLIVELDSYEFHSDRTAFENDRNRDADTLLAGYETIRVTWERLNENPRKEAVRLAAILAARRKKAA